MLQPLGGSVALPPGGVGHRGPVWAEGALLPGGLGPAGRSEEQVRSVLSRRLALGAWGGRGIRMAEGEGKPSSPLEKRHLCRDGAQGPQRGVALSGARRTTPGEEIQCECRNGRLEPILSHS